MTELLNFALDHLNYGWICFLMLLESTVIPVPSELVVAPAAFNAAEGTLNIWLVILFATIGADCGASINYAAGYYLGRPLIYKFANSKWGKLCLLNQKKVEQAEKYFDDNGAVATITGRLVVGVRHLISIPAGLARMNFWRFLLFTTIGAGIWNCILAALGWWMHSFVTREELNGKIEEYSDYIKITLIVLVIGVIIFFLIKHFLREKNK
ncbi:MAG: DedA family protein [Prevotella sp.]|nr:DedA family protein [Prevotella sp.]MDY4160606.1 DedA family protein [Prevotella sp.]